MTWSIRVVKKNSPAAPTMPIGVGSSSPAQAIAGVSEALRFKKKSYFRLKSAEKPSTGSLAMNLCIAFNPQATVILPWRGGPRRGGEYQGFARSARGAPRFRFGVKDDLVYPVIALLCNPITTGWRLALFSDSNLPYERTRRSRTRCRFECVDALCGANDEKTGDRWC